MIRASPVDRELIDLAHLRANILNRNLHILIGVFLPQESIQGLIHLDQKLAGLVTRLICSMPSVSLEWDVVSVGDLP